MGVEIFEASSTERCEDYKLKINGRVAELGTARVSAFPFNRRWPGHQRGQEQSELVNFISLSADEPLSFEIVPPKSFEKVIIRPEGLNIRPDISDGVIRFTLDKPRYFTVEPYGRNNALHIFVDPVFDYGVDINDENVIYFGRGEHNVGTITLESNQTLFIDEGAVVFGCVKAVDAENIRILGNGILDNSKNKEKILFEYNAENNTSAIKNAKRQHTVQLEYCENITIKGITIRDSLVYNIRPIACKRLNISNVKIIGCWRYNSDGIDMHNCEDVVIENCFIRTFDDSICIKGFDCYYEGDVEKAVKEAMYRNGKAYDVFRNVLVKNCVIWNDWGKCLEIGAETRAEEITNIHFLDCCIIHVTHRVLDINNVDYADVNNIRFENISVEYDDVIPEGKIQTRDDECYEITDKDYAPYLIAVETEFHHEYSAGGLRRGINRNITFKNIRLSGRQKPVMYFKGYDNEHKTKDITVENLYWNKRLLPQIPQEAFIVDEFTENIKYSISEK